MGRIKGKLIRLWDRIDRLIFHRYGRNIKLGVKNATQGANWKIEYIPLEWFQNRRKERNDIQS